MRAALILTAVLIVAGCGGHPKPGPPSRLDIADVTAAAQRVLAACESGGSGDAAQADVDTLVRVYRRSDPDARFQLDTGGETVTMRTILRAVHNLLTNGQGTCMGGLDVPVGRALRDG